MPFAVVGGDAMGLRQAVVGVLRTGARSGASPRRVLTGGGASGRMATPPTRNVRLVTFLP